MRFGSLSSCQNPLNDSGFTHAGQLLLEAILRKEELVVMEPQQVQDRRVPVRYADAVLHGCQAEFVGGSIRGSAFDAGAGHPGTEGVLVVVAPRFAFVLVC